MSIPNQTRKQQRYFVYIMSSHNRVLYTGMTNDIELRIHEHKSGSIVGFSSQYRTHSLVYFEETGDVREALGRERAPKGWTRARKIALIETENSEWHDLSAAWAEVSDTGL